ncbi:hypothetical protein [Deinococcus multiflagellatus]|uniref:Uncharacterized protein n=1 Tax=Deinococcus multiflagellatus TaxID=1656887 RepID=A0ABW1ZRB6_9DEIO|nr:hypothetical protein [Deinococcus multiflagellatus]MBZ9715548.1 hypothetical protein [Deinococcus multiflagellatus]
MTRLDRLTRLRFLAMISELSADPCTPERAARARRADRIAAAWRAEYELQLRTEPCGVCGQPGRAETGLCQRCQESSDHVQAQDYAFWRGGAA